MLPDFPSPDPSPVPAPIWLLKILLYVTFLVHLLFMNLTAGGALLTALFAFKGKVRHWDAAGQLAKGLPYLMPFTITFGVAPLLFVQVLYGPLIYTAAVLMGVPFILVIPTVMLAYALMYLLSSRWGTLGALRGYIALGIFLLLGFVGFTYTNLFTLMLEPERFHDMYVGRPTGFQMNLADPTVFPRFLHMMLGAVAVAGLWVAITGLRRLSMEPEQGRWQYRYGATWFAGATIINIVVGLWWLLDVPLEERMIFMGRDMAATVAFGLGAAAGLSALILALMGINSLKPKPLLMGSMHSLVVTVACMIVMRDRLRDATLKADYDLSKLHVASQWGAIALFLALFLAGIGAVVWLLRQASKAASARPPGDEVNRGPGFMDSGIRPISAADSGTYRGGFPDSGAYRRGPGDSATRRGNPGQSGAHRPDEP